MLFALINNDLYFTSRVPFNLYSCKENDTKKGTLKMECKGRGLLVVEDLRPFDHLDQKANCCQF